MNKIRADRLFDAASNRAFMVALDRTVSVGPEPFAVDASLLVESVVAARADAMLMSPGLIKQCGGLAGFRGAPALVCRIDFPFVYDAAQGEGEEFRMIGTVEQAVALGADAVVMFLTGATKERRVFGNNVAEVARVAADADRLGIPLIVEAVPWGDATPDRQEPEMVAQLCRMAAELGADMVKTEHLHDDAAMRHVIDSCPVPVLILGGPKVPAPELLETTKRALHHGARGVVFGRNAWQRDDAAATMASLRSLIHEQVAD